MTNLPEPERNPEPNRERRSRPFLFRRTTIALGTVLLTGVVGGVWWARVFVYERLAPLVETNLSQTLKRPVRLGRVERFSLTGLRFGASSMPATPTDSDQATVEAVDVAFDPLRLLFTRTLHLDVTLIKPNAYVEQTRDGLWVSTQIAQKEQTGPIKTELERIQIQDAAVVVVPYTRPGQQKTTLKLNQVNGEAGFFDRNERITYEVGGQSVTGGILRLEGETLRSKQLTNLQVRFQNQLATEVDRLVKLPISLEAGRLNGALAVQFRPKQTIPLLNGTARFTGITLGVQDVPKKITKAQGVLEFRDSIIRLDNVNAFYGTLPVRATGDLDLQNAFNLAIQLKPVPLANVIDTLAVKLPFPASGRVEGALKLTGPLRQPILSGVARTIGRSRLDRVDLRSATTRFALNTATRSLSIQSIQATPVAGGQVTGKGLLKLGDRGGLVLDFLAQNVPGDPIARGYGANLSGITIGRVNAIAQIFGPPNSLQTVVRWQAPEGTYPARGEVVVAGGTTVLRNTVASVAGGTVVARGQIADGKWQAFVKASQIPLNRFSQDLRGALSTIDEVALSGTLDSFSPRNIRAGGKAFFSQGLSLVTQPLTAAFRWNGDRLLVDDATTPNFGAGAPGVRARGSIAVQLEGTAAPAIAGLDLNVQTRGLDLQTLPVALPNSIQLAGLADFVGRVSGTPTAPSVVGTRGRNSLALRNFVLNGNQFESPLRGNLSYSASRGLDLFVTGRQDRIALQTDGNNQVLAFDIRQGENIASGRQQGRDLVVDANNFSLGFLSSLAGTSTPLPPIAGTLNTSGLRVNLADRLLVGRIEIDNPLIDPLGRRGVLGVSRYGTPLVGSIQGSKFVGDVSLRNGVFRLANGELQQGVVCRVGQDQVAVDTQERSRRSDPLIITSRFLLDGTFAASATPTVDAQLQLTGGDSQAAALAKCPRPEFIAQLGLREDQGRVQDVLRTLQIFDVQDIAQILETSTETVDLAGLEPISAGLPNASLSNQLRRLSEVEALLEQQRRQRQNIAIPSLADLQGNLGGTARVSGSLQSGITAQANFQGQDWQWGPYRYKKIAITLGEGSEFAGNNLTLRPLAFQFDDAIVLLRGQVGAEQQAQFEVRNLPIAALQRFIPPEQLASLPVAATGNFNATATLSGKFADPQIVGEVSLTDAVLNNKPVQVAQGSFQYVDDRLDFGSRIVVEGPQPVLVRGNVPISLPFTTATPRDDISLSLDVRDEGLAVLNLLTPQVNWVSGQGQVNLQVGGTLSNPIATGIVDVRDATIAVQALAAPDSNDRLLTGVTGRARFEGGLIRVEGIQGQYQRGGQITAQGVIPLSETQELGNNPPLTVRLNNIALNLRGLYQGNVNTGDDGIILTGSALTPRIGGEIRLSDGQVLLSGDTGGTGGGGGGATGAGGANQTEVEFNALRLVLGDRIRVTRQPILNFVASGTLTVGGSLNEIQPEGEINLRSGQVNLFTTQFVLERGYEQVARFVPSQGLDPNLSVRLIASVPEVTRSRLPTETLPSEILDAPTNTTSLGALQTIRIQALIDNAPASQLADNLELTSSPSRTKEEIVGLLGGGFVATLGQGADSTLGLANLAGSALLTNIQGVIGNTLGLSEFRLFPTIVRSDEARSSTLGLAAEAGIDIGRNLSASVLRILTADQPTQFGLRYRVNDNVRVRSYTDFSGDSGAVVEYESRF